METTLSDRAGPLEKRFTVLPDTPMGFLMRDGVPHRAPLHVLETTHRRLIDVDEPCQTLHHLYRAMGAFRYAQVAGARTDERGILGWVKYACTGDLARLRTHFKVNSHRWDDYCADTARCSPSVGVNGEVDVENTALPPVAYCTHRSGAWTPLLAPGAAPLTEAEILAYEEARVNANSLFEEREKKERQARADQIRDDASKPYNRHDIGYYIATRMRAATNHVQQLYRRKRAMRCNKIVDIEEEFMRGMHEIMPELPAAFQRHYLNSLSDEAMVELRTKALENHVSKKREAQALPVAIDINSKVGEIAVVDLYDRHFVYNVHVPEFGETLEMFLGGGVWAPGDTASSSSANPDEGSSSQE